MGKAFGNIVWTAAISVVGISVGTIFRLEIEDFWNGSVQPYIEANIGLWVAAMLEYVPTFGGGVAVTLITLLAVDRIRSRSGRPPSLSREEAQSQAHHVDGNFHDANLPRRVLPSSESEAISESALRASSWLRKALPPLSKRAWEIHNDWEHKKLTFQTKGEFSRALSSLSQSFYDEFRVSRNEIIASDPRYQGPLKFAFDYEKESFDFKQAIDLYHNAVRELVDGQSPEILRLYNNNLVLALGRLETKCNHIIRVLGLIGKDPSQYYGTDPSSL
jgi:hypothetical protein